MVDVIQCKVAVPLAIWTQCTVAHLNLTPCLACLLALLFTLLFLPLPLTHTHTLSAQALSLKLAPSLSQALPLSSSQALSFSIPPLPTAHTLTAVSSAKAFFRKLHEYYRIALMNDGVCNLPTRCFSSSPSIMGSYVARPFSTRVHSKFADRETHDYVSNEFCA